MEEGNICLKCDKGILRKPRVFYRIFEGKRQPNFFCDNCGAFHWEHPQKDISSIASKSTEQKEEQKPRKFNWFEEFLKQEKEKKKART